MGIMGLRDDLPDILHPPRESQIFRIYFPHLFKTYLSSYPGGPMTGPYTGGEGARGEETLTVILNLNSQTTADAAHHRPFRSPQPRQFGYRAAPPSRRVIHD